MPYHFSSWTASPENINKMRTDVILIHPPYHQRTGGGLMPPIGLAYLASSLNECGYSCKIIDATIHFHSLEENDLLMYEKWLSNQLVEFMPTLLIGIGPCTTPALRGIIKTKNVIEKTYPHTPLIYGGPFPTLKSQIPFFFNYLNATAVVRGDGEKPIVHIADTLSRVSPRYPAKGVVWAPNSITEINIEKDLDKIRLPSRSALENNQYYPSLRRDRFDGEITTSIFFSRGCPYKCSFCSSPASGGVYRKRSTENLLLEIIDCIENFQIKNYIFYDDCLFIKSKDVEKKIEHFCDELLSLSEKIQWQMEMRGDVLSTLSEYTFTKLQEAGCIQINIGIEKTTNDHLLEINKNLLISEVVEACTKTKKFAPNIVLAGTFILGGVSETVESINSSIDFACKLPLDFAHFSPLQVYPETEIFHTAFPELKSEEFPDLA
jgi:anaerobic magnesium-protoporphyrin IX monomethyl ester cyclase